VSLCDFGHQGLLFDKEFGTYYNRARTYNPRMARFHERDPKGYVDGMGVYQYARSAPVTGCDPMGLMWHWNGDNHRWEWTDEGDGRKPYSWPRLRDLVRERAFHPGGIIGIRLYDAEAEEIVRSAGYIPWTKDNLSEYLREKADRVYPAVTEEARYAEVARWENRATAISTLIFRTEGFQEYVPAFYDAVCMMNPAHFVVDRAYQIRYGEDVLYDTEVSRLKATSELALYLATVKGANWVLQRLRQMALTPLGGEAAAAAERQAAGKAAGELHAVLKDLGILKTLTSAEVKPGMEVVPWEANVFRGGSSLEARAIDVKIADGMVQPTRGVSLQVDPAGLKRFGGAYRIKWIPSELKIIQRGRNMGHLEIVPREPMPLKRFQDLLNMVRTEAHGG
jgi:RHS repeat-associated protein